MLLVVAIAAFTVPWYPVVNNWYVTQTFTGAYSYEVSTQSYRTQAVYRLPSPVTLPGFFQQGAAQSAAYKILDNVSLQTGSIIHVQVTQCDNCDVVVGQAFGNYATVYDLTGSGSDSFIVPASGIYSIIVDNDGDTRDQISSLVLTANVPQNGMTTMIGSNLNTGTITQYSVKASSPYTVLGISPTLAIFAVLVLVVLLTFLFEQRIIRAQKATKRRRRRR